MKSNVIVKMRLYFGKLLKVQNLYRSSDYRGKHSLSAKCIELLLKYSESAESKFRSSTQAILTELSRHDASFP